MQMNDSFFDQSGGQYNSDAARRHTICHEMGHAIGLDHVDTTSCMNNSQFAVFNYVHPINKDYKDLARIYQHKDSSNTVAGNRRKKRKKEEEEGQEGQEPGGPGGLKNLRRKNRASSESTRSGTFFDPTSLPPSPAGSMMTRRSQSSVWKTDAPW